MTFLFNHKEAIAAMDFFVVPTVGFRLLYVWFVICLLYTPDAADEENR